jgi:hypothetical protein
MRDTHRSGAKGVAWMQVRQAAVSAAPAPLPEK